MVTHTHNRHAKLKVASALVPCIYLIILTTDHKLTYWRFELLLQAFQFRRSCHHDLTQACSLTLTNYRVTISIAFFNSKSILHLQSLSRCACLQLSLEQAVTIIFKPFKELVFVVENMIFTFNLLFVVPSIMLYSSEISLLGPFSRQHDTEQDSDYQQLHNDRRDYLLLTHLTKTYNLSEPAYLWPYTAYVLLMMGEIVARNM